MALDINILTSLHGRKLGMTKNGHLVEDGRILLPSWKDRGARQVVLDHFNGPTLSTFLWNVAKGSDGGAAYPVINVQKGGICRAVAGAGAGASMAVNGSQICGSLNWEPDQGGLEFGTSLKLSDITTSCVYAGFTDQTAALAMPFTIAGGVLTANSTDAVGVLFDTAATAATWKIVNVKNGVAGAIVDTGLAPVTTAFDEFRIEVDASGNAQVYKGGKLLANVANAVTKTVPLAPVVCGFRRAAAALNIDIDFISVGADRPL